MSIARWMKVVLKPLKRFSTFSNIFPAYLLQLTNDFFFMRNPKIFKRGKKSLKVKNKFPKLIKSVATLNKQFDSNGMPNDHRQNVENEMKRLFVVCECWTANRWFVPCSKCTHPLAVWMVLFGSAKLTTIHGQAHTPYWIYGNEWVCDNIFPCHTPHDRK